jgi:hypothetical protein
VLLRFSVSVTYLPQCCLHTVGPAPSGTRLSRRIQLHRSLYTAPVLKVSLSTVGLTHSTLQSVCGTLGLRSPCNIILHTTKQTHSTTQYNNTCVRQVMILG